MRILIVSDLHVEYSEYNRYAVSMIGELAIDECVDFIGICGDISGDYMQFDDALDELSTYGIPILFVPGNHDIWTTVDDTFSMEKLDWMRDYDGAHCLMRSPMVVDDIAIVGTMGWYDYSFADPELEYDDDVYARKYCSATGREWMDGRFARFGMSDKDVADMFNRELESHLKEVNDCRVKIVLTHFAPFLPVQKRAFPKPSYFNAYGGNDGLGRVMLKYGVDISVSGHLHKNFDMMHRGIRCYQTGIDYLHKPIYSLVDRYIIIDV